MAENSTGSTVAKFGIGIGAGFGIYWLITHFGGFGLGGATAEGRGSIPSPPASVPSLPTDALPLLFWVEGSPSRSKFPDPTERARADVVFRLADLGAAAVPGDQLRKLISEVLVRARARPPMRLDEVIARVKAGGRDDVRLMTSGNTTAGSWDDAKDALMAVGIKHWLLREELPSDRKLGAAPKPPHWELLGKGAPDLNPDKNGHYHVEWKSTAYWNIAKAPDSKANPVPYVSGYSGRGQHAITRWQAPSHGRGHYGDR